jgi:outer membrane phospholipase A
MEKPSHRMRYPFFIRLISLFLVSYVVYLGNASAQSKLTTLFSSDDPFYQVTLYRENYILPYHYLDKVIQPRPATMDRTHPIFNQRIKNREKEKREAAKKKETMEKVGALKHKTEPSLAVTGHRRNLSSMDRRQGGIFDPTQMPKIPITTMSPIQSDTPVSPMYQRNRLHRAETAAKSIKLQRRLSTLNKLEGAFEKEENPQNKGEIAEQIEKEEGAMIELFEELGEELGYKFVPHSQYIYMEPSEVAFQISLKIPLLRVVSTDTRFYAAYTQQSWWQTRTKMSAFFRESNYMPEFFIEQPFIIKSSGLPQIENLKIGVMHQSNGAGLDYERSWNRALMEIRVRWGSWCLMLEPWWIMDTKDMRVYNKEIYQHTGYGKASVHFKHRFFHCTFQKQKSAYQVLGSIPLSHSLNCTFYYFSGKGSTLGLYDKYNASWGIGIGARG